MYPIILYSRPKDWLRTFTEITIKHRLIFDLTLIMFKQEGAGLRSELSYDMQYAGVVVI